ncbi:hypothetical protein Ocin01_18984 [Orchesella cincta]|uniref:Uncharacterized protein n=1 Tax=Orchesella cincta TaxID=48709 RepID=A0A1D2M471_ORCCI|nr:hypothetical protein Ocin01_18984 [Orchesella cincta]
MEVSSKDNTPLLSLMVPSEPSPTPQTLSTIQRRRRPSTSSSSCPKGRCPSRLRTKTHCSRLNQPSSSCCPCRLQPLLLYMLAPLTVMPSKPFAGPDTTSLRVFN